MYRLDATIQASSLSMWVITSPSKSNHKFAGRAITEVDVRDRAVLHHDLHDERGIRERRLGDWQREDILHSHDDCRRSNVFWELYLFLGLSCYCPLVLCNVC